MTRRCLTVSVVACLIALACNSVRADLSTYTFTDTKTWDPARLIEESQGAFVYEHDINYLVDISAGHFVTDATLTVTFTDDETDGGTANNEITKIGVWDGGDWDWSNVGNVETGDYIGPDIDVSWLNDNGWLRVSIEIVNNKGDVWLNQSVLSGVAAVPVPAGLVLGVLGFGVAGLKLRKFV